MSARWIAAILGGYLALSAPAGRAADEVVIVAAGDIQWGAKSKTVGVAFHPPRSFYEDLVDRILDRVPVVAGYRYLPLPYVHKYHEDLGSEPGNQIEREPQHSKEPANHDLHFDTVQDAVEYP